METRDFFLSYNNRNDGTRAEWIAKILKNHGYTVHFQKDDCITGMSFPRWMNDAIQHSRGFIAVWSGAYEESEYCQDELEAAYVKKHTDKTYKLLPVRVSDVPVKNALFAGIVHADLLSLDEARNRAALLKAVGYDAKKRFAPLIRVTDEEKNQVREMYFRYLSRTLGEIQFEGMPTDQKSGAVKVPLEQIFVPLRYVPLERPERIRNGFADQEINIHDVLTESPRAAILAKPGGGKSTLIRRIALAYADPQRRGRVEDGLPDKNWFPVYLRCRDLHDDALKSIGEIIATIAMRAEMGHFRDAFLAITEEARNNGQMLLLIDGLDEISNEQERLCFVQQLHTYVDAWPNIRLVLTSREAGFRTVAGDIEQYCDQFSIMELNEAQIRELALKWHEAILGKSGQTTQEANRVSDIILKDGRIEALAGNPLLLTTLLFVKRWVGYLPTQKCRLYQEMVKLLLVSWNAAAHEKLDLDETEPQLAFVAYSMTREGKQVITESKLKQRIIEARKAMPELLSYTKVSPSQFISLVEERSSLLIMKGLEEDERGQMVSVYEFSHLSFQEYLTARAITENWLSDDDGVRLEDLFREHMRDVQWVEVMPLAAVLCGRSAIPAVKYLLSEAEQYQSTDGEEQIHDAQHIYGNAAALHLANCLANEVPMGPELLKQVIETAVRQRYTYQYRSNNQLDVFTIILNSRYGVDYREIVHERLFENLNAEDSFRFINSWRNILQHEEVPDLQKNLSLLKNGKREDTVNAVLSMMDYPYLNGDLEPYRNVEVEPFTEFLSAMPKLLQTDDVLILYVAVYHVAIAGLSIKDHIPHDLVHLLTSQLITLWLKEFVSFRGMISLALGIILTPDFPLPDTPELRSSIQSRLTEENSNERDRAVALCLGILNHQLSDSEIRDYLTNSDDLLSFHRDFLRKMGYLDERGKLIEA